MASAGIKRDRLSLSYDEQEGDSFFFHHRKEKDHNHGKMVCNDEESRF